MPQAARFPGTSSADMHQAFPCAGLVISRQINVHMRRLVAWGTRRVGRRWERPCRSGAMPSPEELARPLARAINIYSRVTKRELDQDMRRELARHIKKLAQQGVEDPNRLT